MPHEALGGNASSLILLSKIGQAGLLMQIPDVLVIPAAVAVEIGAGGVDDPARRWLMEVAAKTVQP